MFYSKPYKVAPGKYLGAIARRVLSRLWWLLIVPVGLSVAGLFDSRFYFLALIVLMLIYPAVLTISLLSEALRPEVVRRAASRRISIERGLITIYHLKSNDNDDDDLIFVPVETIEPKDYEDHGQITQINFSHKIYDFLLVPSDLNCVENLS